MERTTVDFGIDLGTTNSSIAMFKGGDEAQVFKGHSGKSCLTTRLIFGLSVLEIVFR